MMLDVKLRRCLVILTLSLLPIVLSELQSKELPANYVFNEGGKCFYLIYQLNYKVQSSLIKYE